MADTQQTKRGLRNEYAAFVEWARAQGAIACDTFEQFILGHFGMTWDAYQQLPEGETKPVTVKVEGLTPKQEEYIEEWLNAPGRHIMTVEESYWAERAAAVAQFIEGAGDVIEGIDWMSEYGIGGDLSALREAVSAALSKFMPPESDRSTEDAS